MSTAPDHPAHIGVDRFAIASPTSGCGWHAVDLDVLRSHRRPIGRPNPNRAAAEVFSVCGARSQLVPRLGPFTYSSTWLNRLRCERCSWVVAFARGTIEAEIDLYVADAGNCVSSGALLRQIFTAILADAPPGPQAGPGHRSELLAHAARHRPVLTVRDGEGVHAAHESQGARCPAAAAVCQECSFTAGSWAGQCHGVIGDECVVSAPCSALRAFAGHYGIAVDETVLR